MCNPRRAHDMSLSTVRQLVLQNYDPRTAPKASLARWERGSPQFQMLRRKEHMIDFPKHLPQKWQSVSPLRRCARTLSRRNREKGLLPCRHPGTEPSFHGPRLFPPSVGTPDFSFGSGIKSRYLRNGTKYLWTNVVIFQDNLDTVFIPFSTARFLSPAISDSAHIYRWLSPDVKHPENPSRKENDGRPGLAGNHLRFPLPRIHLAVFPGFDSHSRVQDPDNPDCPEVPGGFPQCP